MKNEMKVRISGIDEVNLKSTIEFDELYQLNSDLELMNYLNENYEDIAKNNLKEKYYALWKRLIQFKDESAHAKKMYFALSPYFQMKNIEAMISENFDNQILKEGWIPKQLYTISGLSGGGKTSLAIMITTVLMSGVNPLLQKKKLQNPSKVLYVNLEQANEEIEKRIISAFSLLNNSRHAIPYSAMMNMAELENISDLKVSSFLYSMFFDYFTILNIEDFITHDVEDICNKISEMHDQKQFDLVIIDQYQNIKDSEEVSERIATRLRNLAKEIELPVVVLAQMNKASQRDSMNEAGIIDVNKISGIALKGASALEQQSSNVTFILPTGKTKKQYGHEGEIVTIVNKKGRYGTGNQIQMLFLKEFNLFVDISDVTVATVENKVKEVFIDENI